MTVTSRNLQVITGRAAREGARERAKTNRRDEKMALRATQQSQRGGTTSCASRPSAGIDRAKCLISLKATGEQESINSTVGPRRASCRPTGRGSGNRNVVPGPRPPLPKFFSLQASRNGPGDQWPVLAQLMLLNGKPIEPGERPNLNRILRKMIAAGCVQVMPMSPATYRVTKLGQVARSLGVRA